MTLQASTRETYGLIPAIMQQDMPSRKRARFKTVSWASDDTLRQIRLFSAEDAPAMAGNSQQQSLLKETKRPSMPDLPPGFGPQQGGGVRRIRADSVAVAAVTRQLTWRPPLAMELNPEWQVVAGGSSLEVPVQREREKRTLEAMYPRLSLVPDRPQEPDEPQEEYDDELTPVIPLVTVEDEEAAEGEVDTFAGFSAVGQDTSILDASSSSHYSLPQVSGSTMPQDWDTPGLTQQRQDYPPPASCPPSVGQEGARTNVSNSEAELKDIAGITSITSQALSSVPVASAPAPSAPAPSALAPSEPAFSAPAATQAGPSPALPPQAGPYFHVKSVSSQAPQSQPTPVATMAIVAPILNSAALSAGGADVTAATAAAIATMSDSGLIDRELLVKILSSPGMIATALAMQGAQGPPRTGPLATAAAGPTAGTAATPRGAPPVQGGLFQQGPPGSGGPGSGAPQPMSSGQQQLGAPAPVAPVFSQGGPGRPSMNSNPANGAFPGSHPGRLPFLHPAPQGQPNMLGPAPGPSTPAQGVGDPAMGQLALMEGTRDPGIPYPNSDQPGQSRGGFLAGQEIGSGPQPGIETGRSSVGQPGRAQMGPHGAGPEGFPSLRPSGEPRRDQGMMQPNGSTYHPPQQYPMKPGNTAYSEGASMGDQYDGLSGRNEARLAPTSMSEKMTSFDPQFSRRDSPLPRPQEEAQHAHALPLWVGAPHLGRGKLGASPRSLWDSPRDSEASPGGSYHKADHDRHGRGGMGGRGRGRSSRVCAYYNTARGCRNGASCVFIHEGPPGAEGGALGPNWVRGRGRAEISERDRGTKRTAPPLEEGELIG